MLIFDRLFILSCGFCESIFQCPTMRYSVFEKFSCYTPVLTHTGSAIEFITEMVVADKTTIMLYRFCKSFFHGHFVDVYSSCERLWSYVPVSAHALYISKDVSKVVAAWFIM